MGLVMTLGLPLCGHAVKQVQEQVVALPQRIRWLLQWKKRLMTATGNTMKYRTK